jgi:hypothetical protein
MDRYYFKTNEITILKKLCELVECNIINENKINITAFTIAKETGLSYPTVRNKLKKIKEI